MMYMSIGYSLIFFSETDLETTLLGHQVELEWRLKVLPSNSQVLVLNFTVPRYAFYSLFYNSRLHVIFHEWSRFVFVASTVCFVWDAKPNFPTSTISKFIIFSHDRLIQSLLPQKYQNFQNASLLGFRFCSDYLVSSRFKFGGYRLVSSGFRFRSNHLTLYLLRDSDSIVTI